MIRLSNQLFSFTVNILGISSVDNPTRARLADIPKDLPADSFYEQIRAINSKIKELSATKAELESNKTKITTQAVSRDGLLKKVKRTIAAIEKAPPELRRTVEPSGSSIVLYGAEAGT